MPRPAPLVSFPAGQTGSRLLRGALAEAIAAHPDAFAGLSLPAGGRAFKRALGEVLVDFEARRLASPDRLPVARRLAGFLAERVQLGDAPLSEALAAAPEASEPVEVAGTARPGWIPRIRWAGDVYEGAAIGALADRMQEEGQLAAPAADGLRWTAGHLLQQPVDLSGRRFALLGAGAELAPTPYLLEAGARVLWVDREPPAGLAPGTFGGVLAHVPGALDLLRHTPAIAAAVAREAEAGPVHLGLYAYAPGKGRELLLTAAMNAVAEHTAPASIGLLISPTTPGRIHPGCRAARQARRERLPSWQRALVAVGALQARAAHLHDGVEVSRAIVGLQGPTYQAAQYLTKMMAAEAWAADRPSVRVSASTAGITHTRSLEHPLFLAGFEGAPAFGIHVFEPEQTRVLTTLLWLHDLLRTDALAQTAPEPEARAARVLEQVIHGGVRTTPFLLDPTIRAAAILGLSRRPSLLGRLVTGR